MRFVVLVRSRMFAM